MDIMTMTKNDFAKELKKRILAGDEILLVDVMNKLCPGNYRVEIYTEEGKMNSASFTYRGFFKFSSEEWPPNSSSGEGEPEVDFNDRDCGINLDLYQKVKIVDDHLLYKSMNKLSYMRYANSVLSYLNLEYECEDELDHSPEGVMEAKKFIKKCYENDMTFIDCCGSLVREVIRKNNNNKEETQDVPEGL